MPFLSSIGSVSSQGKGTSVEDNWVTDLTTATYDNIFLDLAPTGELYNRSLEITPDGGKLYLVRFDNVGRFFISNFDIATARSFGIVDTDGGGTNVFLYDVAHNSTGDQSYLMQTVVNFGVSQTRFNTNSTSNFNYGTPQPGFVDIEPNEHIRACLFNKDGSKLYTLRGFEGPGIEQYTLTTPFDISSYSADGIFFPLGAQDGRPVDFEFNADGTKIYMAGETTDTVYQYSLTTAYDLSTISYDNISFKMPTEFIQLGGISFNRDGSKLLLLGDNAVHQYSSRLPHWKGNLSSAAYDSVSFSPRSEDDIPIGITFGSNGTTMVIVGGRNGQIFQYSLGIRYDITTATYNGVFFDPSSQTGPGDVQFNLDGSKMYILGDRVYQYSLSTEFDISTATYDSVSFNISEESQPLGFTFSLDGTKMFVVGQSNETVYRYDMPAFDLQNASYTGQSFSIGGVPSSLPVDVALNIDGTKLYVLDQGLDTVYEYFLYTPFDLSTSSLLNSFNIQSEEDTARGLAFNPNGTKMFIVGFSSDSVHQYTTG